jgi:hypothetical protein
MSIVHAVTVIDCDKEAVKSKVIEPLMRRQLRAVLALGETRAFEGKSEYR